MSDENPTSSNQIEVDDAAAYFGVTESSDVLHAMMAMPREEAMVQFFELLSDIVLRPGDFDFEAASERMQCEGGEIYYLVAGHLGLMSMPDPLFRALGMPDSSGEVGAALGGVSEDQRGALERLADPMRMMKLFAVAFQTGSNDEVVKYMTSFEGLLNNVEASINAFVAIDKELDAALDVVGQVIPIASLASGSAAAASVDVPENTSLPTPPVVEAESVEQVAPPPTVAEPVSEPEPVPLPTASPEPSPADDPVPLPMSSTVALPDVPTSEPVEPELNIESEKQVAKATQDAFSGAFSSELVAEEEPLRPPLSPKSIQRLNPLLSLRLNRLRKKNLSAQQSISLPLMKTAAVPLTLKNSHRPQEPALRKRLNCTLRPIPTGMAWSHSRNSSPPLRPKRRLRCPNRSPLFVVLLQDSSKPHNKHRLSNDLNPCLSSLGNNNSNLPNKVGRSSNSDLLRNKVGHNNNRLNKGGLVNKPLLFNQRFARACTAVDAGLDWTRTGDSALCAASKTSAIEGPVLDAQCATNCPSSKSNVSSIQMLGRSSTPEIWMPTAAVPPKVVLSPIEK